MKDNDQPYLGLVTSIAFKYWRGLPQQIANHIDVSDLISGSLLALLKELQSKHYNPRRSSPSTFVYYVVESHCKNQVTKNLCQKRFHPGWVDWEAQPEPARPDYNVKFMESRVSVEQFIRDASPGLQRALSQFLKTRRYRGWKPELLSEARVLVRRHNISYGEFLRVLERV